MNCYKCGIELTGNNWYPSSQHRSDYICIECAKIKGKGTYEANKTRYIKNRKIRQEWISKEKKKTGCELCGYNINPAALQFHHINAKSKQHKINSMYSISANKKERKKCMVLCANCHAEIHHFDIIGQQ